MHISKIDNFSRNINTNKAFQGKVVINEEFTKEYSKLAQNEIKKGIAKIEKNTSKDTIVEFNLNRTESKFSIDSYAITGYRKVSNTNLKHSLVEPIDDILYTTDVQNLQGHSVNPIAEIRTLFSKGSMLQRRLLGFLPAKYVEDYSAQDGKDMDRRLVRFNILESFKKGTNIQGKDALTYKKMIELINILIRTNTSEHLSLAKNNFIKNFKAENTLTGNIEKIFNEEIDNLFDTNITGQKSKKP